MHSSVSYLTSLFLCLVTAVGVHQAKATVSYDQVGGIWKDDYSDTSGLSSQNHVAVDPSDGQLKLTNSSGGFAPPFITSGSAITTTIIPTSVARWGNISLTVQAQAGTSLTVQVLDESGAVFQDERLPGNPAGFTGPSVDLGQLPPDKTAGYKTGKFARIRLKFTLTTSDVTKTPTLDEAVLSWTVRQGDLSAAPLADTAWPILNVNAQGTQRSAATAIPPYLVTRWFRSQEGDFGGATTRGFGNTIFNKTLGGIGGPEGTLTALNRHTGDTIWDRVLSGYDFSEVTHTLSQNGTLYISDIYNDILLAYDTINNGSLKWTHQFFDGHGNTRVAIGPDGKIYTLRTLKAFAFNPDGSLEWTRDLPSTHSDPSYSQIVFAPDGVLYFAANTTSTDGALYALDPATGADQWPPIAIGPYVKIVPLVDSDGTIYIANDSDISAEKKLFAFHPDSVQKWERSIGITTQSWNRLALRSDGALLAERVSAFSLNPPSSTEGAIEGVDTANGNLLWSLPTTSDNGAFGSELFVDGSDGFFLRTTLHKQESNIRYFDSGRNEKWHARYDSPGVTANFHNLIQDEDGVVYGNLFDATTGNVLFALSPWTISPCVRPCNVSPGSILTLAATTPMHVAHPQDQMQVLLDTGDKVSLRQRFDDAGDAIWVGYYKIPTAISSGTHGFTVEANAARITTDIPVNFASPAIDSGNTGVTTTGTFGIETNPCNPDQVCTTQIKCSDATSRPFGCIDHRLCYRVRETPRFSQVTRNLVDDFESTSANIKKAKELCLPADTNGEGILDPNILQEAYSRVPSSQWSESQLRASHRRVLSSDLLADRTPRFVAR